MLLGSVESASQQSAFPGHGSTKSGVQLKLQAILTQSARFLFIFSNRSFWTKFVDGFEKREHMLSIFLDLCKAFDYVHHETDTVAPGEMWHSGALALIAQLLPGGSSTVTSEPPTTAGQAGCLQGQITQRSPIQAAATLDVPKIWLSCDNR
ncbi:hypothetical protein J6590_074267 [Homalodisca vitripennis]|nr:hypothetical protein J6590_074267 [Homalodisca vitripennis]